MLLQQVQCCSKYFIGVAAAGVSLGLQ